MPSQRHRLALPILLAALAAGLSGCAGGRTVLDLRVAAPPAPGGGRAVRLVKVVDARQFAAAPATAAVPSLFNGGEWRDAQRTARAVAQARDRDGRVTGDLLLPAGRTVADVVRETVAAALGDRGYVVLAPEASAPADAIPLEVEIRQFWAWCTPGSWTATLEFRACLVLTGELVTEPQAEPVLSHSELHTSHADAAHWRAAFAAGLKDLRARLGERFRSPN